MKKTANKFMVKAGVITGAMVASANVAMAESLITIDDTTKTNIIDTIKEAGIIGLQIVGAGAVIYYLIKLIRSVSR